MIVSPRLPHSQRWLRRRLARAHVPYGGFAAEADIGRSGADRGVSGRGGAIKKLCFFRLIYETKRRRGGSFALPLKPVVRVSPKPKGGTLGRGGGALRLESTCSVQTLPTMPGGAISCTQALPVNLQNMFGAKPATIVPIMPEKRKMPPYTGIAGFVQFFAPSADDDYQPTPFEPPTERRKRNTKKRKTEHDAKLAAEIEAYKPHENDDATKDAFKSLFVGRLSYEVDQRALKKAMERFGKVKKLRLVTEKESGKPRGYAFVEFEDEADMKRAYKQADGMKLEDKRIVVDVERGRTVKNWKPRRLGGGLGGTRIGKKSENRTYSGRDAGSSGGSSASGGGYGGSSSSYGGGGSSSLRGSPREYDRRASSGAGRSGGGSERPRESGGDRDRRQSGGERERERSRRDDRGSERPRDRDRERDRRDRDRERDRDRDRGSERPRDRDRERDRRDKDRSDKDRK
jgi:U1 small nuclear ribonucleoprotein